MCNYLQVGERGHVVEDAVGELRDFIAVEGPEGGGGEGGGGDKNKQVLVFGCWRSELKTLKHVCSSKQIARILNYDGEICFVLCCFRSTLAGNMMPKYFFSKRCEVA